MHAAPLWLWPRAAYVHIPFCAHHCGYCDFAVAVGADALRDRYLEALGCELSRLGAQHPVKTLFLGGGTPSYLTALQLERLMALLHRWLPLDPDHEFSIEANPSSLDADKIGILADAGVNRVSLGAQSFEPALLQVLERDHAPTDVAPAVEAVRRRIDNISLDLIFGVPRQTLQQWHADIDRAVALAPTHIATYGLTYERGTPLWKMRQRGVVNPLDENAELTLYETAMDRLAGAGFEHYEISNFARPGYRCRHNQVYWANHAHFGFGMGAAQYVQGTRTLNVRSLDGYLRRALAGLPVHFQSETLAGPERALETASVQLRRAEGIRRDAFEEQTGHALDELIGSVIARHVAAGFLNDDGAAVFLSRRGKTVADEIICTLWRG